MGTHITGEGLGKSNLPHSIPPTKFPDQNDQLEPEVIPQTSSDESSSATADSDSSASNNKYYLSKTSNIVITEDEPPESSGYFL